MRFFRYTLLFSIIIALIVGIVVIGMQSLVLFQAQNQFLESISVAKKNTTGSENYRYCSDLGTEPIGDGSIYTTQLRFISDQEYLIEIVCNQFEFKPKTVRTFRLPSYAKKLPGKSGFVFTPDTTWSVTLEAMPPYLESLVEKVPQLKPILDRTKTFSVENTVITAKPEFKDTSFGPVTNCSGYGYTCCDPVQSIGIGDQRPGSDCSDSCYSSCQQRPMVLSFNAEPNFDRYQRQLIVSAGTPATFTFVINALLPELSKVTLDFGDGNTWNGTALETSASHSYQCNRPSCSFVTTISVVDAYGIEAAQTTTTQIQVQVSP